MKIAHDFHVHTHLSVCAKESATILHYANTAKKLGFTKIGFADHFWDEKCGEPWNNFYARQGLDHVLELKKELATADFGKTKVYFGCETEYNPITKAPAITEAVAEQFDFVIVPNSHTHMMMPKELYEPYEKHKDFMIEAYYNIINSDVSKYILSMAHPFEAVCCPYDNEILMKLISDDEYRRIYDATAKKGIAVEINTSGVKNDREAILTSDKFRGFRLAKECGCKFTFGSDSHTDKGHDDYADITAIFAEELGLSENDLAEFVR